jgi:hypothetical protein
MPACSAIKAASARERLNELNNTLGVSLSPQLLNPTYCYPVSTVRCTWDNRSPSDVNFERRELENYCIHLVCGALVHTSWRPDLQVLLQLGTDMGV